MIKVLIIQKIEHLFFKRRENRYLLNIIRTLKKNKNDESMGTHTHTHTQS